MGNRRGLPPSIETHASLCIDLFTLLRASHSMACWFLHPWRIETLAYDRLIMPDEFLYDGRFGVALLELAKGVCGETLRAVRIL